MLVLKKQKSLALFFSTITVLFMSSLLSWGGVNWGPFYQNFGQDKVKVINNTQTPVGVRIENIADWPSSSQDVFKGETKEYEPYTHPSAFKITGSGGYICFIRDKNTPSGYQCQKFYFKREGDSFSNFKPFKDKDYKFNMRLRYTGFKAQTLGLLLSGSGAEKEFPQWEITITDAQ